MSCNQKKVKLLLLAANVPSWQAFIQPISVAGEIQELEPGAQRARQKRPLGGGNLFGLGERRGLQIQASMHILPRGRHLPLENYQAKLARKNRRKIITKCSNGGKWLKITAEK